MGSMFVKKTQIPGNIMFLRLNAKKYDVVTTNYDENTLSCNVFQFNFKK